MVSPGSERSGDVVAAVTMANRQLELGSVAATIDHSTNGSTYLMFTNEVRGY